jgi:hypothetical protein
VKELRAHSEAKTPVARIVKITKRNEGSLRQKAIKLGIKLGHGREAKKAPPKRGQSLYSSSASSDLRV